LLRAAALNLGLGAVPQLSSLLRAAAGEKKVETLIRSIRHALEPVEAHPGRGLRVKKSNGLKL